jgi:regulatory protein
MSSAESNAIEVTALTSSKKRGDRFDIRAGKRVLATLSWDEIEQLGIGTGTIWSDALAERIARLVEVDDAFLAGIRLLARRPLAGRDLTSRLKRKGHSESAVAAALDRLIAHQYVDDEACARQWIEHFMQSKPAGRRMIEQKLRAKFLDGAIVNRLLSEMLDDEQEEAMARRVAEKKWRTLRDRDAQTRAGRLYRFLASRGFGSELCRKMTNELASHDSVDAEDDFA